MKYCKGEVVRVRDDIRDLYTDKELRCCFDITYDMSRMGGKHLTINDIDDDNYHTEYAYVVRENDWWWQESLLLPTNSNRDDIESVL